MLVCNNVVSPFVLISDFMVKTRKVLDLSEGRVSFKFVPEKSFPFSTVFTQGSCLQISRALDQPLLRCHLGTLSDEQCARMQEVVSRHPDVSVCN